MRAQSIKDSFIEGKRVKRKRAVFTILMIGWMILIFCFSSRDADLSSRDSGAVGIFIGRHFVPGFEEWSGEEQQQFAERIDHPVRKTAHATEYAILGMLAFGAVGAAVPFGRRWWIAWLIVSAYAVSDEVHQYFVPGRACMLRDVCLDSAGAAAGIAVICFLAAARRRRMERKD